MFLRLLMFCGIFGIAASGQNEKEIAALEKRIIFYAKWVDHATDAYSDAELDKIFTEIQKQKILDTRQRLVLLLKKQIDQKVVHYRHKLPIKYNSKLLGYALGVGLGAAYAWYYARTLLASNHGIDVQICQKLKEFVDAGHIQYVATDMRRILVSDLIKLQVPFLSSDKESKPLSSAHLSEMQKQIGILDETIATNIDIQTQISFFNQKMFAQQALQTKWAVALGGVAGGAIAASACLLFKGIWPNYAKSYVRWFTIQSKIDLKLKSLGYALII